MNMIQLIGLVMVYTGLDYCLSRRIARAFAALVYPTEDKSAGQVLSVTEEDQNVLYVVCILVKSKELFIKNNRFYRNSPIATYEDLKNLHKGE